MKWILGIIVSLAIAVLIAAKFYIPNQFHELVHKKILKDAVGTKVYKVISSSQHQTILTTEKNITTITSVTTFNPLTNHVLFERKDLEDVSSIITATISYEILASQKIKLNVLFADVQNEKTTLIKPLLSFITPLEIGLIKNNDFNLYLLSHLKMSFTFEKLKYDFSEVSNDITMGEISISTQTPKDKDLLSITGVISAKEIITINKNVTEKFTDLENNLNIESFKMSGLRPLFKKEEAGAPEVPMAMKAMGLIPKIESFLTIPFKITMNSNASHESGKMPMNFELLINNANIMEKDAYHLKAGLSLPYKILESQLLGMMSVTLAQVQAKDFNHPDFQKAYTPGADFVLAMKFDQDKNAKLVSDFREFLEQKDESNQSKVQLILTKAEESGLLKKEGDIYSAEFVMENMVMTLNGKPNFKEEFAAAIPQADIDSFLISKGYVSLVAEANAPKKSCYALLPGFPKQTGSQLSKAACVSNCESLQQFCLTNPNEKHLCYLYQCSWENEVLSYKNEAPVPAEKAVLTKHLIEVKAKLKASQQVR